MPAIPLLKLVVEDLEAYYTETRTHRDSIDDLELMGEWFWEKTKAGRLLLLLEAVSLASKNKVMLQIVEMSLMAPRFWSEGPLPGTSAAGWWGYNDIIENGYKIKNFRAKDILSLFNIRIFAIAY